MIILAQATDVPDAENEMFDPAVVDDDSSGNSSSSDEEEQPSIEMILTRHFFSEPPFKPKLFYGLHCSYNKCLLILREAK